MEVVDHVDVFYVRGGRLVSDVHRVFQRQIPHGESFELGVARLNSPLIFVIKLAQTGCKLSAVRPRRVDDDERPRRFYVSVFAVALVADYGVNVGRIAFGERVSVHFYAAVFKFCLVNNRLRLFLEFGDDDAVHHDAHVAHNVDKTHDFGAVGYAVVGADFVAFDVVGGNGENDFRFVLELLKKFYLRVAVEAGKHPRRVQVVKQLATEFEVKLAARHIYAFQNVLVLLLHV